jgi:hypothetical protein
VKNPWICLTLNFLEHSGYFDAKESVRLAVPSSNSITCCLLLCYLRNFDGKVSVECQIILMDTRISKKSADQKISLKFN